MSARLIGVGTGPGDPELLTLKAVRAILDADVIAHFLKRGRAGNARAIVATHWPETAIELPLPYPVTTEMHRHHHGYKSQIAGFFDESAHQIAEHLDAGRTVAVLSEGDPFFYGSYMHIHVRLADRYETEVIPGITSLSGCWSQAGVPLMQGDDIFTVLPGTLDVEALAQRLANTDSAVIMKVGRNLPKIRQALEAAGKMAGAIYVERGTMQNAVVMPLAERDDAPAPYFSQVLVPGWAGRP
ncbi:precorrin-2 C(20)-methyltransferase [Pelagibacterium luteolum]|uniref:Precorrin-2/cobalt-factor-2 C20-methyltransferase n=1 Tax=Pelagibacterium luteolum TaxID=440168 RepID=A0A1G7TDF0_9HYPH|nr:precorrin-2 C(20)-methyltransferase [Pelagibacterium luteolum]SDG33328.1 precorrin-2/cobalt-factor-2 C20-methyltransferase [Pelagibacterium luteolum]